MRESCENVLKTLAPLFQSKIDIATSAITQQWNDLKRSMIRKIPPLPMNAEPTDLNLKLESSGKHLDSILDLQRSWDLGESSTDRDEDFDPFESDEARYYVSRMKRYVKPFNDLALKEDATYPETLVRNLTAEQRCFKLADSVVEYMEKAFESYKNNAEQLSRMILTTMELWVDMDKAALEVYPLLRSYKPPFSLETFNVLQLPTHMMMLRLQKIEDYLRLRSRQATISCDIFAEPSNQCFGARYYEQSPHCSMLRERIESQALSSKTAKLAHLEELHAEYENLSSEIAKTPCDRSLHWRRMWCPNCSYTRQRQSLSNMGIWIFEHPLPSDVAVMKTVVFELTVGESFLNYRNSTWTIISNFCYTEQTNGQARKNDIRLLNNYSGLQSVKRLAVGRITLGSQVKSFYETPQKHVKIPNSGANVVLPHRMRYSYFDSDASIFPNKLKNPSIEHLCCLSLPSSSPFSRVLGSPEFKRNTQSSYAIIASQSQCPSNVNIHEHFAYQTLFFGQSSRWPNILRELGSATLNFSYEAIMLTIQHLAWEAGPEVEGSPHRLMHFVFTDVKFCKKLLQQTSRRVASLVDNYREGFNMELLLTLLLRLFSLGPPVLKGQILEKIHGLRAITERWMRVLREKIQSTTETEVIKLSSEYALRAALICRATFAVYEENGHDTLEKEELVSF